MKTLKNMEQLDPKTQAILSDLLNTNLSQAEIALNHDSSIEEVENLQNHIDSSQEDIIEEGGAELTPATDPVNQTEPSDEPVLDSGEEIESTPENTEEEVGSVVGDVEELEEVPNAENQ